MMCQRQDCNKDTAQQRAGLCMCEVGEREQESSGRDRINVCVWQRWRQRLCVGYTIKKDCVTVRMGKSRHLGHRVSKWALSITERPSLCISRTCFPDIFSRKRPDNTQNKKLRLDKYSLQMTWVGSCWKDVCGCLLKLWTDLEMIETHKD